MTGGPTSRWSPGPASEKGGRGAGRRGGDAYDDFRRREARVPTPPHASANPVHALRAPILLSHVKPPVCGAYRYGGGLVEYYTSHIGRSESLQWTVAAV